MQKVAGFSEVSVSDLEWPAFLKIFEISWWMCAFDSLCTQLMNFRWKAACGSQAVWSVFIAATDRSIYLENNFVTIISFGLHSMKLVVLVKQAVRQCFRLSGELDQKWLSSNMLDWVCKQTHCLVAHLTSTSVAQLLESVHFASACVNSDLDCLQALHNVCLGLRTYRYHLG